MTTVERPFERRELHKVNKVTLLQQFCQATSVSLYELSADPILVGLTVRHVLEKGVNDAAELADEVVDELSAVYMALKSFHSGRRSLFGNGLHERTVQQIFQLRQERSRLGGPIDNMDVLCLTLQHLGILALAATTPCEAHGLYSSKSLGARNLLSKEVEVFGINHIDAAGMLLEDWGMPAMEALRILHRSHPPRPTSVRARRSVASPQRGALLAA